MYSSTRPSASTLDGGGWSTPRPGRFTPRERPGTHCRVTECDFVIKNNFRSKNFVPLQDLIYNVAVKCAANFLS